MLTTNPKANSTDPIRSLIQSKSDLVPSDVPDSYFKKVCEIFGVTDNETMAILSVPRKLETFGIEWD